MKNANGCKLTRVGRSLLGIVLAALGWSIPASGQDLIAADDTYGVPIFDQLLVEAPGVLENDIYMGEPAEDGGATVALVDDATYGNLVLSLDGSFTYDPDPDYPGTDSFTYRVSVGGLNEQATVTLSACDGGPTVFSCWMEAPYLAKLAELGIGTFQEGFEDDVAWGTARYTNTAPSIVSQGIEWTTNYPDPPASNEITTGGGPARTGLYGVFDPDHGYATGTTFECDVDTPPDHCLFKDGLTGVRQAGESTLYGVGGYFAGTAQPNLVMILDGGSQIGLGSVPVGGHQFYGVIDASGFSAFRYQDIDGKIGQHRLVFADDFTFGAGVSSEIFADGFESGGTTKWSITLP